MEAYDERAVPRTTAGEEAEERKAVRADTTGVEATEVARVAIMGESER